MNILNNRHAYWIVPLCLLFGVLGLWGTVGAQTQGTPGAGKPPFANAVDQRDEMIRELREIHVLMKRLWNETELTVVMVTHDLSEAFRLATRVIAFERNRDRPEERERYGATISRDLEIFPRRTANMRHLASSAPAGTTRPIEEHEPGRPGTLV